MRNDPTGPTLDRERAARLARLALGHVRREFPFKLDHVLVGCDGLRLPRALHPIFHGSYDWHSCVHTYWMLARLTRLFPDLQARDEIAALFEAMLTPANVAAERRTLDAPEARGFERPYGWAWLLALAAELADHPDRRWRTVLAPLSEAMVARLADYLPKLATPVRNGSHHNTAFAMRLAADWAEATGDAGLTRRLGDAAHRLFSADADCPAWGEPGGEDFLSPTLIEAECMRRHMAPGDFAAWFAGFLPAIADRRPATLLVPASVSDRSDGRIAHLDGLNLSRAWCWRSLARALPTDDPRCPVMREAADAQIAASLPYLATDYMGEHWLATFAVLALTA